MYMYIYLSIYLYIYIYFVIINKQLYIFLGWVDATKASGLEAQNLIYMSKVKKRYLVHTWGTLKLLIGYCNGL